MRRRRTLVGVLSGVLSVAAVITLPAAAALADGSSSGGTPTRGSGGGQWSSEGPQRPSPANGTSSSVCANAVAPGQAACQSRRRTDSSATTAAPSTPGSVAPSAAAAATLGNSGAYDPSYLQSAYNAPSATGGSGQTVAIVDAYDDPHAEADMGSYRSFFGLSACTTANGCFRKINETGGTSYPTGNSGWGQEISLDLDMVSALCPNCHILLVEASTASIADLGTAVNEAVALGANVVSNSYGGPEFSGEATYSTKYYNHPGVAITVSAGDSGYGAQFPATSNTVISVGGTSLLQATNTGSRNATETVWNGSGSGCSAYMTKPAWQTDTGCSARTSNDVAAVADPNTGVWVYDTYGGGSWGVFGGTSVAAPIIGAVYALANNAPGSSTQMNSLPYAHAGALNDVTSGSNGSCSVAYLCTGETGYDGPTGLGTPNGAAAFTGTPIVATAPNPPTNLSATGANAAVNLTWTAPSSGGSPITGYNLYRSTSSGTETLLVKLGVTTSYSDTAVTNGKKYFYEITAVNNIGESTISAEASATPSVPTVTVPSAPQSLSARTASRRGVVLYWSAPLSNGGSAITGYRVYRSTSSGQETSYTTVACTLSSCQWQDTGASRQTYYYEVAATNSMGTGPLSNQASAYGR